MRQYRVRTISQFEKMKPGMYCLPTVFDAVLHLNIPNSTLYISLPQILKIKIAMCKKKVVAVDRSMSCNRSNTSKIAIYSFNTIKKQYPSVLFFCCPVLIQIYSGNCMKRPSCKRYPISSRGWYSHERRGQM